MQRDAGRPPSQPTRSRGCFVGLSAVAFLLGVAYVAWLSAGGAGGEPAGAGAEPARATRTPRPTKTPKAAPTPSPPPRRFLVGVVAGHWQNDSGAVCEDGLQEVTINLDVASRTVAILQSEGYDAELLAEFSERLSGYKADAFVSIHTDSCAVPGVSGYKVARLVGSAIPEQEDRLVECLVREYGEATGLSFHRNTVTFDMTDYHAFWEIDPQTPGAIIELGFMAADREILTERSYTVAQGVARGIVCFLEGN